MRPQDNKTALLIRYLEGELSAEENEKIRNKINQELDWQQESNRLRRTQLKPDEEKVYPWKDQLKKPETFRIYAQAVDRAAAVAALLLLFFGIMGLLNIDKFGHKVPNVSAQTNKVELKEIKPLNLTESIPFETPVVSKTREGITIPSEVKLSMKKAIEKSGKALATISRNDSQSAKIKEIDHSDKIALAKVKSVSLPSELALPVQETKAVATNEDNNTPSLLKRLLVKVLGGNNKKGNGNSYIKTEGQVLSFNIQGEKLQFSGKIRIPNN